MHEAEDRHADEFLRRVTQQPLDRARASEDAAFAVELEHERIGRVGDEAARVLLLRQRLPELELRLRAAAQAKREDEDQEEDRQACDCGAGGNERGGGGGRERDPPRTSADLGARDGRAARPVREDGGAVGDPHVEPLRQAGERGRGELVRRERADDDAEQGVAPLRGRIERQVTGEDGDEGERAEAAVALQPDRRRKARPAGAARAAKRLAEGRVRAEVEHVRRVAGRLLAQKRIREARVGRSADPHLLTGLQRDTLRGRDPGRPADGDDLGSRERDAGMGRERLRVDRARRVVGGADALKREHGRIGPLLEPGGGGVRPLVGLGAHVALLVAPEHQRQQ